jgi:ribosome-associated protein
MKAIDIQVLDIRKLTQIADYFVICAGISDRQIKAIAQSLKDSLKDCGVSRLGSEGEAAGGWVLLDYVDVIVHIFNEDARGFYQLELLWGDAGPLDWQA